VLGPVLFSLDVHQGFDDESLITQVRYSAGTYSYIYAVQTSPYFPTGWGHMEGEPNLQSVAVTGHPLGETWSAMYNSSSYWGGFSAPTNTVVSMTAINDGIFVVPELNGAGSFTVFYMQSSMPPAMQGTLTYNARNYCFSASRCFVEGVVDENGERLYEYDSFDETVLTPIPEPASFVLLGAGLAALEGRRLARSRRAG